MVDLDELERLARQAIVWAGSDWEAGPVALKNSSDAIEALISIAREVERAVAAAQHVATQQIKMAAEFDCDRIRAVVRAEAAETSLAALKAENERLREALELTTVALEKAATSFSGAKSPLTGSWFAAPAKFGRTALETTND